MALVMDNDDVGDEGENGYARSHVTSTSTTTELQQIWRGDATWRGDEKSADGWRRSTVGWRSGVVLNVVLSLLILIAGFVCFVVAGTKVAFLAGDMKLFAGSCSMVTNVSWGLHALINVAVLVLLVGANYVFQVLSSPTRSEIAEAHESRRWLEIGVPSLRNCRYIGGGRSALAILLVVVAVATHIMWAYPQLGYLWHPVTNTCMQV